MLNHIWIPAHPHEVVIEIREGVLGALNSFFWLSMMFMRLPGMNCKLSITLIVKDCSGGIIVKDKIFSDDCGYIGNIYRQWGDSRETALSALFRTNSKIMRSLSFHGKPGLRGRMEFSKSGNMKLSIFVMKKKHIRWGHIRKIKEE